MIKSISISARLALFTALSSTIATAPTWAAESESIALEEVTVTARKIEESAQTVPIAITALTKELTNPTIRDITDLNGFAPTYRLVKTVREAVAAQSSPCGVLAQAAPTTIHSTLPSA